MKNKKTLLHRFKKQSDGATAIEYGLIAAGISLAIMTGVQAIGDTQSENYESINGALSSTPSISAQQRQSPTMTAQAAVSAQPMMVAQPMLAPEPTKAYSQADGKKQPYKSPANPFKR